MANEVSLVVIGQASVGMQHVQWFQLKNDTIWSRFLCTYARIQCPVIK